LTAPFRRGILSARPRAARALFSGATAIAHHLRRFFIEALAEAGQRLILRDEEAHHLLNVIRVRLGEEVELLDGSGRLARARLVESRRREATLHVLSLEQRDTEPRRRMTLLYALPRASRMDTLVEKCCELGLKRLSPMVTARSVVDPLGRQENHLARWRRIVIEAAKQSGRTRLMEVTPALPYDAALRAPETDALRLVAAPGADSLTLSECAARLAPDQPVVAVVGPEGGFTPEEMDLARRSGCHPVSLGKRILRVETAAIALCSWFLLGE